MKTKEELLKQELSTQMELFRKAIHVLSISYRKCETLGLKDAYTDTEMELYEVLTSRFARAGDILTQKIFRLIDELELEERGSVIDRINRAEKRLMISSAELFKDIRQLRNRIAHEYAEENILDLLKDVFNLSPLLIQSLHSVEQYSGKYLSL